MSAEIEDLVRESRAARKVQAAMVLNYERDAQRIINELKAAQKSSDGLAAEVRKNTEELAEVKAQMARIGQSDEARWRASGKVFDRLTRLSIMQATSLVVAAFATAVFVAGLSLALTEPRAVLSVVLQVVSTATRSEPPPTTLPEKP